MGIINYYIILIFKDSKMIYPSDETHLKQKCLYILFIMIYHLVYIDLYKTASLHWDNYPAVLHTV